MEHPIGQPPVVHTSKKPFSGVVFLSPTALDGGGGLQCISRLVTHALRGSNKKKTVAKQQTTLTVARGFVVRFTHKHLHRDGATYRAITHVPTREVTNSTNQSVAAVGFATIDVRSIEGSPAHLIQAGGSHRKLHSQKHLLPFCDPTDLIWQERNLILFLQGSH